MPLEATTMGPAQTVETKLRVENLNMVFTRDGKTTAVLQDICLEVSRGEFVCLVGPSGCGKTTLLNTIGGFLPPDERNGEHRRRNRARARSLAGSSFSKSVVFFPG